MVTTRPLHLTHKASYLGGGKLDLYNLRLILETVLVLTLLDHLLGLGAVSLLHHQALGALVSSGAGEAREH